MTKPHNNNERQEITIEIEIELVDRKSSYITRGFGSQAPTKGVLASHCHERLLHFRGLMWMEEGDR